MLIPGSSERKHLQFNITPLIDIVFLLIIFFLVATHVANREAEVEIDLPTARTIEEEEQVPQRVVVTITKQREYYLSDQTVSMNRIANAIREAVGEDPDRVELRIRTDENVPFEWIDPLMQTSAESGLTQIKFAVIQK